MSPYADRKLPPVTRAQLKAYAEASGDHNPIHLDEEVAKKAGLPGVIAHGMLSAAWLAERALSAASETGATWRLAELQTRFRAMVFPGDELIISTAEKERGDGWLVLELQAKNARGEVVTMAVATFTLGK